MDDIRYTPLDEAAEIIADRRNNEELQQKLAEYLGCLVPAGPFDLALPKPAAILAEHIAQPTARDAGFATTAMANRLAPWWLSYENDQFLSSNQKKVGALRPALALPNKNNLAKEWLVLPPDRPGPIGSRPTVLNQLPTVSDYWRMMRQVVFPRLGLDNAINSVLDISDWYRVQARRFAESEAQKLAVGYYPAILGLYATRAVLFSGGSNPQFRSQVFCPAFERVATELGVDPVIVKFDACGGMDSIDGKRRIAPNQTDVTFLDLKLSQQKQPSILKEVTRLALQELQNEDNERL